MTVVQVDLSVNPDEWSPLTDDQRGLYDKFASQYSFPLDNFQKYAIHGLIKGHDVLVTVPTSSGKTVIAEFGIFYCQNARKPMEADTMPRTAETGETPAEDTANTAETAANDSASALCRPGGYGGNAAPTALVAAPVTALAAPRVIYTSPIKTLSNQKFSEFSEKYRDVGIVTGDVKFNPEANCLIMTTEILRDLLFKKDPIVEQLGVVIFDEVHYINNDERGHVWEQCLMLLPPSIRLILLSATISHPEKFANWISRIKKKPMDLIVHHKRPVPLNYYLFTSERLEPFYGGQKSTGWDSFPTPYKFKPRSEYGTVNRLLELLKIQDLCPALFFVFSRVKCEQLAKSVTCCFHDSKQQVEIERLIDELLRKYQYNYNSIKHLPQIEEIKALATKGVSYHHSGLLPISKEIVEVLFSRGHIKVMFVTETFSVGINMPTRTVVFTDLCKNVNGKFRQLHTDEFFQMAGRAGRRGLDAQGTVIYSPTRDILPVCDIRSMLEGEPMAIKSRYHQGYLIVLQQLNNGIPFDTVRDTYLYQELEKTVRAWNDDHGRTAGQLETVEVKIAALDIPKHQCDLIDRHDALAKQATSTVKIGDFNVNLGPKQLKHLKAQIGKVKEEFKKEGMFSSNQALLPKYKEYSKLAVSRRELIERMSGLQTVLSDPERELKLRYDSTIRTLRENGHLDESAGLTSKGLIAANISHTDGLLFSTLLTEGFFSGLDTETVGLLLGLLTADLGAKHDFDEENPIILNNGRLRRKVVELKLTMQSTSESFPNHALPELSSVLLFPTHKWLNGGSFLEISADLGELQGNFVRSMVKLLRLSEEVIGVFQITGGFIEMEVQLRDLIRRVNRDIVIFDSIYVKGENPLSK